MSCEEILGSMVALLDGELHGDERRTVELHLGVCATCQGELELLRATLELVSRAASGAVAPSFDDLWRRVEASGDAPATGSRSAGSAARTLRSRRAGTRRSSARRRVTVWAGAAGLAVAAGLALVIVGPQGEEVSPAAKADKPAIVAPASAPASAAKRQPGSATRVAAAKAAPRSAPTAQAERALSEDAARPESDVAVVANEIDPPRELLERPDLFVNYPIVRRLDELRHLESVLAESPDAGGAG